jgi:hypothetical protein
MVKTFYLDDIENKEYHTKLWTNRSCLQKIETKNCKKPIHIFLIRVPHNNDKIFDVIESRLVGKNYRIVLWNLDHSDSDTYYDTRILSLYKRGEDILKVTPDVNIKNNYPFEVLNTYSMADSVLEQQQNERKLIMRLFEKSIYYGRMKHFLCLNGGVPKTHRVCFVNKLYENNLLDMGPQPHKFNISFLSWYSDENKRFTLQDINDDIRSEYDKIKLPEEMYPMHLDLGRHARGLHTSLLNIPLYFSSYIDVVTMAKFEQNGVYLDEKIYKSFACLMPFVIVGQFETLKVLKELGFKTFSPIINEDYDNEKDNEKRMDLVIEEIKRLNNMTHSEIDNMFWEFKGILIHNFKHLKNFINETDDYLIKKICQ